MNEMTTLLAKDERFTFGDAEILSDYRQRRARSKSANVRN